jgi:hypothetical protein
MSYEKTTRKAMESLREQIQLQLAAKNLDNTGEAARSLELKGTQLWGIDYIYYLDKGRKAGKFPPSLISWVREKLGLQGAEAKQADFLIRRSISRQGTTISRNPEKGLELDKLVTEMLDGMKEDLADEVKAEALTWL